MKKKLLLGLLWFSCISLTMAKNGSIGAKKPTLKQVYGAYKVTFGAILTVYSLHSMLHSIQGDTPFSLPKLAHNNFPEMIDFFLGTHCIYFGTQDVLKMHTRSRYLYVQKGLCEIVTNKCALRLAKEGWNYIKHRAFCLFARSKL